VALVSTRLLVLSKGLFTANELNKLTQLHDAPIGHARQRHDVIGCSETRTVGRLVLIHSYTLITPTLESGVRENVWNYLKNVKSHVLDFEKKNP